MTEIIFNILPNRHSGAFSSARPTIFFFVDDVTNRYKYYYKARWIFSARLVELSRTLGKNVNRFDIIHTGIRDIHTSVGTLRSLISCYDLVKSVHGPPYNRIVIISLCNRGGGWMVNRWWQLNETDVCLAKTRSDPKVYSHYYCPVVSYKTSRARFLQRHINYRFREKSKRLSRFSFESRATASRKLF